MAALCFVAIASLTLGQSAILTPSSSITTDLQYPGRLAAAPGGGVFVTDQPNGAVHEYDSLGAWVATYSVPEKPLGIAVHPDGRVIVSRADGNVAAYEIIGDAFVEQSLFDPAPRALVSPNGMAIHPDTDVVYVVDGGAHEVMGFAESGGLWTLVVAFGTEGSGPLQFVTPQDIAIDVAGDRVLVTDVDNFRVQVINLNSPPGGDGIPTWDSKFGYRTLYIGSTEAAWFARSEGIALDDCGNIYIADALMGVIRAFDTYGVEIDTDHLPLADYGTGAGQLRIPIDIVIQNDQLFVTSLNNSAVEIYDLACAAAPPPPPTSRGVINGKQNLAKLKKQATKPQFRQAPDNPMEIVEVMHNGEYCRRLDLNRDHNVDMLDLELAVAEFGAATVEDFMDRGGRDTYPAPQQPPHLIDIDFMCGRCHSFDGLPGGMLSVEGQENLCLSCHSGSSVANNTTIGRAAHGESHPWGVAADAGDVEGPPVGGEIDLHTDSGNIRCGTCHNPHDSDEGSPYLRMGVSYSQLCGECHQGKKAEWLNAGHADTTSRAFTYPIGPTHTACVKCHSGLGHIDFTEGVDEADQNTDFRVHACITCHDPHNNTNSHFLRMQDEVTLPGGYVVTDAGESAECMACHEGRATPGGYSLTPHYALGAVMLEGINAAEFGNTSLINSAHTEQVACVDCHMADGPAAGPGAGKVGGHTFAMAVHDADDPDFGFENVDNTCVSCHATLDTFNRTARGDYDGDGTVEGVQDEVQGLLDLVYAEIILTGAIDLGHYPYWDLSLVVDDPPGFLQTVKDAIWNYKYVLNDGSGGVHNTAYAVGVLQLTYEELTGSVLAGAYLRYVPEGTTPVADYTGSDTCSTCHPDMAALQTVHSHSHKLKPVSGAPPTYPLEGIYAGVPNTPVGAIWDDVSYVIGGYYRKARFITQLGNIMIGAADVFDGAMGVETQWNLEFPPGGSGLNWVMYHDTDTQPKPYNYSCFQCHTTGPQEVPGGFEDWAEPGVQCEACHGPGSGHADDPYVTAPIIDTSAAQCGTCHTRGGDNNVVVASGGYIKHHEQYPELLASPHDFLNCVTCHEPHTSAYYDTDNAIRIGCATCHSTVTMGPHDGAVFTRGAYTEELTCESCHMAYASKSATAADVGVIGPNARMGDIKSHIFNINTDAVDYNAMFTPDGSAVLKDGNGEGAVTLDFVCLRCHNGIGNAVDLTLGQASLVATVYHQGALAGALGKCTDCHTSRPADHTGDRDVDACGLCHVPYGNTLTPVHDGTTTGCTTCHTTPEETHTYLRDDTDQTIFAPGAEAECIACHRDGGYDPIGRGMPVLDSAAVEQGTLRAWLQPGGFMAKYLSPAEITEVTDWVDVISDTRTLAYDPYLEAPYIGADFVINGLGDNPAWAGASEHLVGATPTIFTATNQVKLKALYSDTYLYVRAEWADSTLSMTRGAWIFDPVAEEYRHPTAANQYEKQSEDRFSIIWNLTIPDFKDRYGCAVKCHGNVPGSSEYTDLNGSIADIWHSKAARGLGLYSATDNGALTVETAMESFEVTAGTATFSGVLDDKWLIWYMDIADGYDTEDSGRRGDAGSSAYSHNRNGTKTAPVWIETAPTSWVDAMVLTQAEIDALEAIDADPGSGGYSAAAVAAAWANYTALDAVVPERILRVPTGSRGDVEHAATWSDGVWINEFKRQLLTGPGNTDDVQFDLLTATDYEFSLAVFDNCGRGEIPPGHTTYGDVQYQVLRFLP